MYIQFPAGNELKVIDEFKEMWDIPQCTGSIDGSHIPVMPPGMNHTDYYNRKGWYLMLVQAVIDHKFHVRNLWVVWLGSVYDARVLANLSSYKKWTMVSCLLVILYKFKGVLCDYLIGDSAYPLLLWPIKPFSFSPVLTSQQTIDCHKQEMWLRLPWQVKSMMVSIVKADWHGHW